VNFQGIFVSFILKFFLNFIEVYSKLQVFFVIPFLEKKKVIKEQLDRVKVSDQIRFGRVYLYYYYLLLNFIFRDYFFEIEKISLKIKSVRRLKSMIKSIS